MKRHIFLGLNHVINENLLIASIVQVLVRNEVNEAVMKHFHYAEIFLIKEYILQLYGGSFIASEKFGNIVFQALEDLDISLEDMKKPQFTLSFGPNSKEYSHSL